MVRVYAAAADNGFRHGAKDPVGKVNQVRTEFGGESTRIFFVHSPIDEPFEFWIGHGSAPITIAMPVPINVRDVSDLTFTDALDHLLKPRRVTILMAHLKMFAAASHRLDDLFGVLDSEAHRFFAIDMPAALQCSDHMLGMETERRGDNNCIQIARLQQATMIAIDRRVFACDLSRGGEPRLVYVAESSHTDAGHAQKIPHQFLPTTAGANDAEADLVRGRDCVRRA